MITHELPPRHEMMNAFLNRDAGYDGVFVTAVATTGICRVPRASHGRKTWISFPRPETR
jgi:methylphosphotriester-DNA--protein-cysteine methyltransferase